MAGSGSVSVRYWAAARAAAGVESEAVEVPGEVSLEWLLRTVVDRHRDRPRLPGVVGCCSVLLGDRPVGTRPHADVTVRPGDTVELLPPFAGG